MIPQLGFFELIVLAALALIVVGPKDLPRLMNGIGKFIAQAKALANEFRAGFDQMAREAEIDEMRKEIESLREMNPMNEIKQAAEDAVSPLTREKDRGRVVPEDEDPFFPSNPPEVPKDAQVQMGDVGEMKPLSSSGPSSGPSSAPSTAAKTSPPKKAGKSET